MIVVKIELWPRGHEIASKEIGRMYIANDGTAVTARGNYDVKVARRGAFEWKGWRNIKATREARVENYPRQSYNVWRLITRALKGAFPEEA